MIACYLELYEEGEVDLFSSCECLGLGQTPLICETERSEI